MYDSLSAVVGGKVVYLDTYPDFRIDLDRVADAITPRTKAIIFNSPANPTGVVAGEDEVRGLAELAARRNVVLISDEIYRAFCYDRPFVSPAKYNPQTLVIDGFSKTYGMPGWRLGFAHGPSAIIQEMIKLQQYSFVCAPQPVQWAGAVAMDVDMTPQIEAYRRKRDLLVAGLADDYELVQPGGAFYAFPKAALGHRHGVRHPGDREAPVADHSRQRLQPPRHPLPHLLRRRRRRDRARHRGPAKAGLRGVKKRSYQPAPLSPSCPLPGTSAILNCGNCRNESVADACRPDDWIIFACTECSVGTKKTGKGRRKIGRKKRRNRARIRHRK